MSLKFSEHLEEEVFADTHEPQSLSTPCWTDKFASNTCGDARAHGVNGYTELLLLLLSCFSRVRLCDPRDGSPPGSPVPGILQARTLEWVSIAFSSAWKWKVKVKSLSHVWLFATPWTEAYQAPPSMGFSRQEYWSGVPLPSPNWGLNSIKLNYFSYPCHKIL